MDAISSKKRETTASNERWMDGWMNQLGEQVQRAHRALKCVYVCVCVCACVEKEKKRRRRRRCLSGERSFRALMCWCSKSLSLPSPPRSRSPPSSLSRTESSSGGRACHRCTPTLDLFKPVCQRGACAHVNDGFIFQMCYLLVSWSMVVNSNLTNTSRNIKSSLLFSVLYCVISNILFIP